MEISWRVIIVCLGLLLLELCNGYPINLENTVADSHTQLLTGLVAVLLTVCSIVLLAGCLCCNRRHGFKEFRNSPVIVSTASNLDHGHVNPIANGEFTIFTPLSPPHQNNNVFLANHQIITRTPEDYRYGDLDVSSWFSESEKDFPRVKLKYIRELGKGWFGKVVEGTAQDPDESQTWTPVAVRILEASASSKERVMFLHDAAIYRCGDHPNILKLIGKCLDTAPLLILQELCAQGDLKNYLRQNKATTNKILSTEYPLIWCCQITSALKHLHENNVTHPDLAARNCYLYSNLTLKLGDYGLSVSKYPEDYYQGIPDVPVRWCSPESLSCTTTTIQPKKISKEANVWSLGVTLWEICQCGEQPYAALTDDEVITQVLGSPNIRLTRPSFSILYTDYIFRLMQLCWTSKESRPTVAQIDLMLTDLLQVYKNTKSNDISESPISLDDFDKRWDCFKPNAIVKTDDQVNDSIEMDTEMMSLKPLSPSLNNLHGSLDNLFISKEEEQMESWLQNVVTNSSDLSYIKSLSDAIKDLDNTLAQENMSSFESSHHPSPRPEPELVSKIEFKLGPANVVQNSTDMAIHQNDSLTDSMIFLQRTSSESETEDENWKKKIERGAYTEKVRLKSKSVADLMILTHIDCSESESDTTLPSIDYRMNYKNVRYAPKHNLENVSLTFGSEGNLLSVKDTFQEELKKLQEERRDSLLFVPDKDSQTTSDSKVGSSEETLFVSEAKLSDNQVELNNVSKSIENISVFDKLSNQRLLQELNSTSEIKPANQIYNVFNVTIDKFSPLHVYSPTIQDILRYNESNVTIKYDNSVDNFNDIFKVTSQKATNASNLDNHTNDIVSNNKNIKGNLVSEYVKSCKKNERDDSNASPSDIKDSATFHVPKLHDIIQSNDFLMSYVTSQNDSKEPKTDIQDIKYIVQPETEFINQTSLPQTNVEYTKGSCINNNEEKYSVLNNQNLLDTHIVNFDSITNIVPRESNQDVNTLCDLDNTHSSHSNIFEAGMFNVPKLYDIIQNNDDLMAYIISKHDFQEEVNDYNEIECKENKDECNNQITADKMHVFSVNEVHVVNCHETSSVNRNIESLQKYHDNKDNDTVAKGEQELVALLHSLEDNQFQKTEIINAKLYNVPKLCDIIEKNDDIMNYIVSQQGNTNLQKIWSKSKTAGSPVIACNNQHLLSEAPSVRGNYKETFPKTFLNSQNLENLTLDTDSKEIQNVTQMMPKENNEEFPESNNVQKSEDIQEEINPKVSFDLSINQDEAMPNSLTHSVAFTSTPFVKKSLQELTSSMLSRDTYSSLNLFETSPEVEALKFSSNFAPLDSTENCDKNLNYSLETWDNFLGKTLDNQTQVNLFDSFSSEPQSLLFIENDNNEYGANQTCDRNDGEKVNNTYDVNKTFEACNGGDNMCIKTDLQLENRSNATFTVNDENQDMNNLNGTRIIENNLNLTYDVKNETYHLEDNGDAASTGDNDSWETGGGWYLHPQSNTEDITGELAPQISTTDSYVGFSMDDEIMAAIRNELLTKLPHAQGTTSDKNAENEERDSSENSEVFLRYNVYNTPLSPIPEESYVEYSSGECTPRQSDEEDTEWSEPIEPDILQPDTETHSVHTCESSIRGHLNRHTPSQDSCCSNDTLFNLEELNNCTGEPDKEYDEKHPQDDLSDNEETICCKREIEIDKDDHKTLAVGSDSDRVMIETNNNHENGLNEVIASNEMCAEAVNSVIVGTEVDNKDKSCEVKASHDEKQSSTHCESDGYINNFLIHEREHSSLTVIQVAEPSERSTFIPQETLQFLNKHVAPLPSPEDKPWKQLPASMLSYEKIVSQNSTNLFATAEPHTLVPETCNLPVNIDITNESPNYCPEEQHYVNVPIDDNIKSNAVLDIDNTSDKENKPIYESIEDINDIYNEADYVNIVNIENKKKSAEYSNIITQDEEKDIEYKSKFDSEPLIIENELADKDTDLFGVLTDIRFNGPTDHQLMSTSFSESNELNDEQDWDSGSDTRSSSSGEFIWKEGEHEESVKALKAAPQDLIENVKPMEGITEEISSDSSLSTSDEDCDSPEFVPSAWDKYATPTKSALRSPEKTLEKTEQKKAKGVWFKKQKYHCVYEYPREPESPILQSHDLWKPDSHYNNFTDWEFDADFIPTAADDSDVSQIMKCEPKSNSSRNLYYLTNFSDFVPSTCGLDDEFYVSSSARPFDMVGGLSSQFFPGNHWSIENATPDSGVEDTTPGSLTDTNEFTTSEVPFRKRVESLKKLASEVLHRSKLENIKGSESLGGLRHTRSKLKLDLPPSPSAFTTGKTFSIENETLDPIITREKPTFSTFGKSRFLVQHVDTPPDDGSKNKNVSFEALPYKPINDAFNITNSEEHFKTSNQIPPYIALEKHIIKEDLDFHKNKGSVEIVRGEASLLDSADEDSGIESSTLERKFSD